MKQLDGQVKLEPVFRGVQMEDRDWSQLIPKSNSKPEISSDFLFSLCPTPYWSSTL